MTPGPVESCPACGTTLGGGDAVARCPACRALVRVRRAPQDRVAAHDAAYFGEQAAYEMNSREVLVRYVTYLDQHRPLRGAHVLDVGCGDSPAADVFAQFGAAYTGLEPSAVPRQRLAARGVDVVARLSDVRGVPDVITMFEVLEHLPAPRAVLTSLRERLPADGVLFLTTPNADGLRARLRGGGWEEARNETHLCLYTPPALHRVLGDSGFDPVARQRRMPFPRGSAVRRVIDVALQTTGLDGGLRVLARPR